MRKTIILTITIIAGALMLSACSSKEKSQPMSLSPGVASPAVSPPASVGPVSGASTTSMSPGTSPSASPIASATTSTSPAASTGPEALPENLPKDFPLPADAKITTSHSGAADGKKSSLLVFTTKESMDAVTKLYKNYFNVKLGRDAVQTIDEKNLIIQGFTKDNKQSWSMIGGRLSSQEGVIELTVTWAET
ncbi:MAG: hypothetical protein K0Q90_3888 [Paenibacillaceae bacterium]|nr:hypothetical protein [Paenibacillaceae bacterium]